MNSGQAHAWLFIALINEHLADWIEDKDSEYNPDQCGPCGALRDYWFTPRGRAEAQVYLNQLSLENRTWVWAPGGVIDWAELERRANRGQGKAPMVLVRKKVYDELIEDQQLLIALSNGGVDKWSGFEAAMAAFNEED